VKLSRFPDTDKLRADLQRRIVAPLCARACANRAANNKINSANQTFQVGMLIQRKPAWQMITTGLASVRPLRVKNLVSQKTFPGPMFIRGRMLPVWQGGLIVLLVFLAYLPALCGGFVWDDDAWTTNLAPLFQDPSGLRLIWFQPTALQQYYPLSGTTFWLDYQLWKFWTTPYHVENVLLHALAALLFWRLLLRLRVPGAWLASALFALHPVMVESVAWITERKNVLSLVFYLGAGLAYLRYKQGVTSGEWRETSGKRPVTRTDFILSRGTSHGSLFYGLAFVLFLGALLAKTTTFSLSAAVLLIGWWQRGQIRWRADVLPTLPFFALALGICAVTAWLEKNHVGAQGPDFVLTFPQRCLVAGRAFWFYLGNLFWPAKLCFVYPRWQPNPGSGWQWLYPATALGTLFTLWLARGRMGRGPVTALFYFVGTLFPVLGFMNAYGMRYSFVWDHWVYLSALGILALVAALVVRVAEARRTPAVVYGFAAIVLPVLALLTWRQAGMYTDMATFWQTTLARNPDCWMAHNNLGLLLSNKGRIEEAMEHYHKAIQINPNFSEAQFNLGLALAAQGRFDEAIENYHKAIQINPDFSEALYNLGIAFAAQSRFDEAIGNYRKAIQINPTNSTVQYNLGIALAAQGQFDEAIECFRQATQIKPNFSEALDNLGIALAAQGRFDEAIECFRQATQIKPNFSEALDNLGIALAAKGRFNEAIENHCQAIQVNSNRPETFFHLGMTLGQLGRSREAATRYREALKLNPNLAGALNNLAWVLATSPDDGLRDGAEAVRLAERACELTHHGEPLFLGTLAAAYAEAGRFPEAVTSAEKAEQLANDAGLSAVAAKSRQLLELYRAGKPYHEPAPTGQ
jgi:tetratricopeptide (TPR) repeat protein